MWSNAQIPAYQFLNLQAISLIIYKQLQQMKQSKLKILKSLWKKRYLGGGASAPWFPNLWKETQIDGNSFEF